MDSSLSPKVRDLHLSSLWVIVYSKEFNKCITCILITLSEEFSCPKTPELPLVIPPVSQLTLATTDLFIVLVLPFPKCHRVGMIWNVAFSGWLFPLSNMHLSFLHVSLWFNNSFFISPLSGRTLVYLSTHLLKDNLGSFQVWAIINKTAVNIHVQGIVCIEVFDSFG